MTVIFTMILYCFAMIGAVLSFAIFGWGALALLVGALCGMAVGLLIMSGVELILTGKDDEEK